MPKCFNCNLIQNLLYIGKYMRALLCLDTFENGSLLQNQGRGIHTFLYLVSFSRVQQSLRNQFYFTSSCNLTSNFYPLLYPSSVIALFSFSCTGNFSKMRNSLTSIILSPSYQRGGLRKCYLNIELTSKNFLLFALLNSFLLKVKNLLSSLLKISIFPIFLFFFFL